MTFTPLGHTPIPWYNGPTGGTALNATDLIANSADLISYAQQDDLAVVSYFESGASPSVVTIIQPNSSGGDVGPLIQAAYDAGFRWIFVGGTNPTLQTPVFFDSTNPNDPVVIQLTTTLALTSSLPTVVNGTGGAAFTPDSTMQFGFFPGTLRSAYNRGANTVEVVNGGTGGDPAHNTCSISSGHGYLAEFPTLIIRGGALNGAGLNAGWSFGNGCATSIEHTSLLNYKLGITWVGYVDGNALIHLDLSAPGAPTSNLVGSWGMYQIINGDGITLDHVKAGEGQSCGTAFLASNHGATIRDCIGGAFVFNYCSAIEFVSTHIEMTLPSAPTPAITVNCSEIGFLGTTWNTGVLTALPAVSGITSTSSTFTITSTAHGMVAGQVVELHGFTPTAYNGVWLITSVTTNTITVTSTINPGSSSVQGTAYSCPVFLCINDLTSASSINQTRIKMRGTNAINYNFLGNDMIKAPDIFIAAANPNSRVICDAGRGGFKSNSGGLDNPGFLRIASSVTAIQTALANPTYPSFQRAITAASRWTLREGGGTSGEWIIDSTDYGIPYYPQRGAITLFASDPGFGTGTLTPSTVYAYALATLDDDGTWNSVSAELDHTAGAFGGIQITTGNFWTSPCAVVLWRGASGSVLTAPTAYAILPNAGIAPFFLDTGANVNGVPWVTTSIPVPNTVAGTNQTTLRTSLPPPSTTSSAPTSVTSSGTVSWPSWANHAIIKAVGGGAGGGGGGAASTAITQVGGGGAGSGEFVEQVVARGSDTSMTVTIGTGGGGGTAGTASGGSGGNGASGNNTQVTGTNFGTINANGGSYGRGGTGNSGTTTSGGAYGQSATAGSSPGNYTPGCGGQSSTVSGFGSGRAIGTSGRAGGGGAPASTTLGGQAGGVNSTGPGTAGTTAGVAPSNAPANTGQGGDGGGGGAWNGGTGPGAGGAGSNGGSGRVDIIWLP